MKGRFAPSPTGYIHLGNVWVALLAYLSVRQQGGTYLVRMEDIDTQRSKRALGEALLDDLEWLGFTWEEGPRVGGAQASYWQSERSAYYEQVLADLRSKDLIYPCFCNRTRLQQIASAPHLGEGIAVYDGACRYLALAAREAKSREKAPSWRLKTEPCTLYHREGWGKAGVLCEHQVEAPLMDFVVKRGDGMFAYNLAVVLDDAAMGVTEVVRGADLASAVVPQGYLYHVLGWEMPTYWHVPLLVDAQGNRLSKRQQSITIRELRELGYTPEEIIGKLADWAGILPECSRQGLPKISLQTLEKECLWPPHFNCMQITLTKLDIGV